MTTDAPEIPEVIDEEIVKELIESARIIAIDTRKPIFPQPTMYKVSWIVGTGRDKDNQAIAIPDANKNAEAALRGIAVIFGGVSVSNGIGGWINGQGELVQESYIQLEVVTDNLESVRKVSESLRDLFQQNCILETVTELSSATFV